MRFSCCFPAVPVSTAGMFDGTSSLNGDMSRVFSKNVPCNLSRHSYNIILPPKLISAAMGVADGQPGVSVVCSGWECLVSI